MKFKNNIKIHINKDQLHYHYYFKTNTIQLVKIKDNNLKFLIHIFPQTMTTIGIIKIMI